MKIRKATKKDLPACVALGRTRELTYLFKAGEEDALAYLNEFLKKGILFVAEEESIIGFISAEYSLGGFLFIDALVVKENQRGKGIGKTLFKHLEQFAKKKKYTHLYLTAPSWNKNTLLFYEKAGMEKGKTFVEFHKTL